MPSVFYIRALMPVITHAHSHTRTPLRLPPSLRHPLAFSSASMCTFFGTTSLTSSVLLCALWSRWCRLLYFRLIEEAVSQIVLHKDGVDPDFKGRFMFDVDVQAMQSEISVACGGNPVLVSCSQNNLCMNVRVRATLILLPCLRAHGTHAEPRRRRSEKPGTPVS